MPFRRAHEIVGAMVRRLIAEGRDFSTLTLKEWKEASDFFGDDAPQAATALESVYAKRTPQSTNPDAVHAVLRECRDWVGRGKTKHQTQIPNPKSQIPNQNECSFGIWHLGLGGFATSSLGFGIWDFPGKLSVTAASYISVPP